MNVCARRVCADELQEGACTHAKHPCAAAAASCTCTRCDVTLHCMRAGGGWVVQSIKPLALAAVLTPLGDWLYGEAARPMQGRGREGACMHAPWQCHLCNPSRCVATPASATPHGGMGGTELDAWVDERRDCTSFVASACPLHLADASPQARRPGACACCLRHAQQAAMALLANGPRPSSHSLRHRLLCVRARAVLPAPHACMQSGMHAPTLWGRTRSISSG